LWQERERKRTCCRVCGNNERDPRQQKDEGDGRQRRALLVAVNDSMQCRDSLMVLTDYYHFTTFVPTLFAQRRLSLTLESKKELIGTAKEAIK
jgi:hypothetical protein